MNRQHSDPNAPWNPLKPVPITPQEFERQVLEWVRASLETGAAEVKHHAKAKGRGGEYTIDIRIRLTVLDGAIIDLCLECKNQQRAVERDELIILEGKLRDTGSHKGILFSTSGFQKGAIEYASAHGIATITIIAGEWLYETRAFDPTSQPPPELGLPRFAGIRVESTEGSVRSRTIIPEHMDPLADFLQPQ